MEYTFYALFWWTKLIQLFVIDQSGWSIKSPKIWIFCWHLLKQNIEGLAERNGPILMAAGFWLIWLQIKGFQTPQERSKPFQRLHRQEMTMIFTVSGFKLTSCRLSVAITPSMHHVIQSVSSIWVRTKCLKIRKKSFESISSTGLNMNNGKGKLRMLFVGQRFTRWWQYTLLMTNRPDHNYLIISIFLAYISA